jgi:hypothetical protein
MRDEAHHLPPGLRRAAAIARTFAQPNRFSVDSSWRDDMTPAQVYETAAIDVSAWIEQAILAAIPSGPAYEREAIARLVETWTDFWNPEREKMAAAIRAGERAPKPVKVYGTGDGT